MDISQERINDLVRRPSEGLNVEIKRWIDPQSVEGVSKIAKAAIALRNRNGGYLVIGLGNDTLEPDASNAPNDVQAAFHLDIIQGIVSKYAAIPFEVQVGFAERDDQLFPVIAVPDGFTVPVAAKKDLMDAGGKFAIREDTVYVRTLGSNGTPSTSAIKAADWRDLIELCFDNREADIGRFLRRQLGVDGAAHFMSMVPGAQPAPTLQAKASALLEAGVKFRQEAIKDRKLDADSLAVLDRGSWEVALVMDPPREVEGSSREFLNKIDSANPQYTGWPAFLVSQNFSNENDRPNVIDNAWQALIVTLNGTGHFDFYRMDAKGEFYQWRILQDDLSPKVTPKTVLDPALMVYRVAEVIAVGLSLARALEYGSDGRLGFLFRWHGMRDRGLDAWASPTYFSPHQTARQDSSQGYVELPADTPPTAIAPYVQRATAALFSTFNGFEYPLRGIEQQVTRLLERRG